MTRLLRKIKAYTYIRLRRFPLISGFNMRPKPIVLVYQMGKVGSTSIYRSLRTRYAHRFAIYHNHFLNPYYAREIEEQREKYGWAPFFVADETHMLHQAFVESGHPLNIITLVRDPIRRNISAYFHALHFVWNMPDAYEKKSLDELIQGFWDRETHNMPIEWLDREFKQILDVDVYAHPFPHDTKAQFLQINSHNFLIMRLDISDALKEEYIHQFLGIDGFKIVRANTAESKSYALTYKNFLREIEIPEWYVDRMLNSQFSCHFFSEQEREELIEYWRKHPR